jgi:hypothetical protein
MTGVSFRGHTLFVRPRNLLFGQPIATQKQSAFRLCKIGITLRGSQKHPSKASYERDPESSVVFALGAVAVRVVGLSVLSKLL